jgi:hypothetical protein
MTETTEIHNYIILHASGELLSQALFLSTTRAAMSNDELDMFLSSISDKLNGKLNGKVTISAFVKIIPYRQTEVDQVIDFPLEKGQMLAQRIFA